MSRYRYEPRFGDALIGGHEGKTVNACGGCDCAVHGVTKDAEMGCILSNFESERVKSENQGQPARR